VANSSFFLEVIMVRRGVIGMSCIAVVALGTWALTHAQQPIGKGPVPEGGQFLVSPAGESAVLVDTKSGKTWVLTRAIDGESVWLPANRIDSADEARDWRSVQKKRAAELGLVEKK
jgi:hypothetical protein